MFNIILFQERELREHFRKLGFYRELPTPELLREAQQVYHTLDWPHQYDDDGDPLPSPPSSSTDEILNPSEVKELDEHALQVLFLTLQIFHLHVFSYCIIHTLARGSLAKDFRIPIISL